MSPNWRADLNAWCGGAEVVMPITEAIAEVAKLLGKVFGFVVNPDGFARMSRDSQLKMIARGMDEAISKNDWATVDSLFGSLERLYHETA